MQALNTIFRYIGHSVFGITPALIGILYCLVKMSCFKDDVSLLYMVGVPIGVAWWRFSYKVFGV